MAAARWWRERRFQEEVRERHERARAGRRLLLPLEETSSGVGLDADTDSAAPTLAADDPRLGDVSSNGTAVEEAAGAGLTAASVRLPGVSSTAGRDVSA